VSEVWADALRGAWAELSRHPARTRQFRTQRLAPELPLDVYAALRAADDAPCLIVPAAVSPSALFEVGGFRLSVAPGEDEPLLVLSLEDLERSDLFVTVCSDAVQAAAQEGDPDSLAAFLSRLDAWRRFLKERRTGLARHEVIGLLGELTVLERLLQSDPTNLAAWTAPFDGLHDFEREGHALEVKASAGVATSLRISTLDQLDDVGLRALDLLHVRFVEAPDGRSLGDTVAEIERILPDDVSRRAFSNALLRRGLMPDDAAARAAPVVSLRGLAAFHVGAGFPRLIRSGVPTAVREVQYDLELRALDGHAVDVDAVFSAFLGVGAE
jgi:hypothetical protein